MRLSKLCYLPVKAELDSYPKKDHQGGNACQRIHPLRLFSTSTIDLKDGLVLVLNTHGFQHTDVLHIETHSQGWVIFDSDTKLAEFNIHISYD